MNDLLYRFMIKKKSLPCLAKTFSGAPEGTRTPDLLVRSQSLYPAELRAHMLLLNTNDILPYFPVFVKSFFAFFETFLLFVR